MKTDSVEMLMWKFMVEQGSIVRDDSFYGTFFHERKTAKKVFQQILEKGINWKKTQPPKDDMKEKFAGTFADHCDNEYRLTGTLVLTDGEEVLFVYNFDGMTDTSRKVFDLIYRVKDLESKTVEDLIKEKT